MCTGRDRVKTREASGHAESPPTACQSKTDLEEVVCSWRVKRTDKTAEGVVLASPVGIMWNVN